MKVLKNYRNDIWRCISRALLFGPMAYSVSSAAEVNSFEVQNGQLTLPASINSSGTVAGYCLEGGCGDALAFVRSSDGTITTYSVGDETFGLSINNSGSITGYYSENGNRSGFLRASDGTITTFDVATVTAPVAINNKGDITGSAYNGFDPHFGFLREADGTIKTFSSVVRKGSLNPQGINDQSEIVGTESDSNGMHGFFRTVDKTITLIDVPGATATGALGINNKGVIIGYFVDGGKASHAFLRSTDGVITSFDVSGAKSTIPVGINDHGVIVGSAEINRKKSIGFIRHADGSIRLVVRDRHGSSCAGINEQDEIVGNIGYAGDHLSSTGFVRVPTR